MPAAIRAKWLSDPVFAPEWRDIILELDKKYAVEVAILPEVEESSEKTDPQKELSPQKLSVEDFQKEPMDESKVAFRFATTREGLTFVITASKLPDTDAYDLNTGKLWVTSTHDTELKQDFFLSHGQGRFLEKSKIPDDVGTPHPPRVPELVQSAGAASLLLCVWVPHLLLPGKEARVAICEWNSDSDLVVLGLEGGTDSEPASWYNLLLESERAKIVGSALLGHERLRCPDAVSSGNDHFNISPVPGTRLAWKYNAVQVPKSTNVASWFSARSLQASPVLSTVWRVLFQMDENSFSPRKPLYFLCSDVPLMAGTYVRLV